MKVFAGIFLLLLVAAFSAIGGEAELATDKEHMKAIWQALKAHEKARGQLPAALSDLVPDFLPDKATLVSPMGVDGKIPEKHTADSKLPCSYGYEFAAATALSASGESKPRLMIKFGGIVPVLRCFLHGKVINVGYNGEVYETEPAWEESEFVKKWVEKNRPSSGSSLTVKVITPDGKPPANARITTRWETGNSSSSSTTSLKADGTHRVDLDKGGDLSVSVQVAEYFNARTPWPPEELSVAEALRFFENPELVVKLARFATAGGIVRDAGGPVAGAKVWIQARGDDDDGGFRAGSVATGADGRWKLEKIPELEGVVITIESPKTMLAKIFTGKAAAGEALKGMHVATVPMEEVFAQKADILLQPARTVKGRLSREDGAALQNPALHITEPSGAEDGFPSYRSWREVPVGADGSFTVQMRRDGRGGLIAFQKGRAPIITTIEVAAENAALDLKFGVGERRAGTITEAGKTPIAGAAILFLGHGPNLPSQPVVAMSDESGNFEWPNAPAQDTYCAALLPSGSLWYFSWPAKGAKVEVKVPKGR